MSLKTLPWQTITVERTTRPHGPDEIVKHRLPRRYPPLRSSDCEIAPMKLDTIPPTRRRRLHYGNYFVPIVVDLIMVLFSFEMNEKNGNYLFIWVVVICYLEMRTKGFGGDVLSWCVFIFILFSCFKCHVSIDYWFLHHV